MPEGPDITRDSPELVPEGPERGAGPRPDAPPAPRLDALNPIDFQLEELPPLDLAPPAPPPALGAVEEGPEEEVPEEEAAVAPAYPSAIQENDLDDE